MFVNYRAEVGMLFCL